MSNFLTSRRRRTRRPAVCDDAGKLFFIPPVELFPRTLLLRFQLAGVVNSLLPHEFLLEYNSDYRYQCFLAKAPASMNWWGHDDHPDYCFDAAVSYLAHVDLMLIQLTWFWPAFLGWSVAFAMNPPFPMPGYENELEVYALPFSTPIFAIRYCNAFSKFARPRTNITPRWRITPCV